MNGPVMDRSRIARLVAHDLPRFSAVNLGIGMPTQVAAHLPEDSGVQLHSENGILGMRGLADDEVGDPDLINASKEFVSLLPGAAIFDHALSFAIMRGGHLDVAVLGAFEVAANGDIANWSLGEGDLLPSVGGAMDLAMGARTVWVMMESAKRDGGSRLVERCSLPLTGQGVVTRVYCELGVFEPIDGVFKPNALLDGVTEARLRSAIRGPFEWNPAVRWISSDSVLTRDAT